MLYPWFLISLPHPYSIPISLAFFPSLCSPLHIAIHVHACGNLKRVFDLFSSFIPYQDYATPLYVASQNGHHDVVQSLLGAGADVNIATSDVSDCCFHSYCAKGSH